MRQIGNVEKLLQLLGRWLGDAGSDLGAFSRGIGGGECQCHEVTVRRRRRVARLRRRRCSRLECLGRGGQRYLKLGQIGRRCHIIGWATDAQRAAGDCEALEDGECLGTVDNLPVARVTEAGD